jgi:two-component system sensor histidine kinase QseC
MRGRLLALLLAVVALAWAAVAALTYSDSRREIDALLDAHLAQAARLLIAQSGHELDEIELEDADQESPYGHAVAFQVWEHGRQLVLKSANAPSTRLSSADNGFSDESAGAIRWRVYSDWDGEREVLVQVAEDYASRERIARHIALNVLAPLAIVLPLLGLAIWWVVGRGVRPLGQLAAELAARGPQDLAPLAPRPMPTEVAGLAQRLDSLFSRIRESLESERRFTSHAAHELRTPVAAIRAQAEVARTTADVGQRRAALDHVIEACDRAARLVEQLLLLARADEAEVASIAKPCRLDTVVQSAMADLAPAALKQDTTLSLDAPSPVAVAGEPTLLEALVRNLVDNAIRHGGTGGRVGVLVEREGREVILRVEDAGPGVPDAEFAQLGQRFYRAATARGTGSGLGLSIVARIVELHRGTLEFSRGPAGQGFTVEARLPALD